MPGVPSGRGCDACRKQKKKCDAKQPSCSRCTRLNLKCAGSGQRRFKFVQVDETAVVKQQKPTEVARLSKPAISPSNEATLLVSSFVSGLGVKDPRFDLACYGPFLIDIPKRLGVHPALDASASALICAYPTVYKRQPSYEALSRYGRALQVLRASLEVQDGTQIVEVLCAIYFLLICQNWLAKPEDTMISHGRAIAQVLNAVAGKFSKQDLGEGFGHQVLISMCMVVILESIWDPDVHLHPWYRANLMAHHGFAKPRKGEITFGPSADGLPHDSITIETLARLPDLVHAPRANMIEIREIYKRARLDCDELAKRQAVLTASLAAGDHGSKLSAKLAGAKMIALCQTGKSLLLSVAMACNALLSALSPWDDVLERECAHMCDEALSLEREVSPSRPLGASHMPLCLVAAYLAIGDGPQRETFGQLLVDYESDFSSTCWLELAKEAVKAYDVGRQKTLQTYMDEWSDVGGSTPCSEDVVEISFCGVQ